MKRIHTDPDSQHCLKQFIFYSNSFLCLLQYRTIVGTAGLPMSIIIVGVGEEDFSAMEVLDGDHGGLKADGKVKVDM